MVRHFTPIISARTLLDSLRIFYANQSDFLQACRDIFPKDDQGVGISDKDILQVLISENVDIPLDLLVDREYQKIAGVILSSSELQDLINAPRQENRNKKFIDPDTGLPSSTRLKEVLQHDLRGSLMEVDRDTTVGSNYSNLSNGDFLVISNSKMDDWVVEIVDFGTPDDPQVTIRSAGINKMRTYPTQPPQTLDLYEFYAFIKQAVAEAPAGKIEYVSGRDPVLATKLPNVYSEEVRQDLMETGGFNIPNIAKLQELLNKIDPNGQEFPMKTGMMFQEKKSPFEIFTIKICTEAPQALVVANSLGQEFTAPNGLDPFTWFFIHFSGAPDPDAPSDTNSMLYKRIPGIADQQSFFTEAIKDPNLKKAFGDLYLDADQKKFVPNIYADKAATHPGARFFRSKSGAFIQIIEAQGDKISFLYSKSIKFTEKDGKGTFSPGTDPIYKQENASYAFVYRQLKELDINEYQNESFDAKTEEAHTEHLHEHGGVFSMFGAYMRFASFNTIGQAFHHGVHMIKHKLEAGNKLQEQEVFFRTMRKVLGPDHPLTREARVLADRERDKTFKDYKQEFLDMKGQSLSAEAKHFLELKRFDKFKLIALIFALVEDSGTLYLGKDLQSLR